MQSISNPFDLVLVPSSIPMHPTTSTPNSYRSNHNDAFPIQLFDQTTLINTRSPLHTRRKTHVTQFRFGQSREMFRKVALSHRGYETWNERRRDERNGASSPSCACVLIASVHAYIITKERRQNEPVTRLPLAPLSLAIATT